ncbi:PREDICTED: uncharacterized protein LOC106108376 isoform X2 [Papilio polytes]|uniref:uncharacterized protein LOC106108376 isoform X2 n=1 Tax=Papilio polytes TaxID=76194 RepID=UPI00067680F0|nr:PREDICTED: uncharacterized protein LOC106108376 isoform X2 [Papilio polytes]XP_013144987.1 PREDICTED: uncharacterized protein LOC106108376 isoform X2 [Papilio polytes]XP_013144988.1 PREDICTED: uncharacterized protein LOC106108376 isoform X2 [Papilio polytes]
MTARRLTARQRRCGGAAVTQLITTWSDREAKVRSAVRASFTAGKARRKEREGEPAGDPKLYLQEALLERKLPELDMRQLVELPRGLDYNEWLASHSQYTPKHYARNNQPFTSGSPPPLLA